MAKFIIKDEIELEKYLSRIVREAAADAVATSGRDERKRQRMMDDLTSDFEKKNSKDEVDEAEGDEEDAAPADEKEKDVPSADVKKPSEQKVADAGLRDIIKTLNVMRSGRSTKDPEVKKALKSYVDGLTSGEQQSLYAFLSGLSEMMVGGETGKEATDPQQVGLKTKPIGSADEVERQDVKVKVKKTEKRGTESAPIVVGENADKSHELRRLNELRRG